MFSSLFFVGHCTNGALIGSGLQRQIVRHAVEPFGAKVLMSACRDDAVSQGLFDGLLPRVNDLDALTPRSFEVDAPWSGNLTTCFATWARKNENWELVLVRLDGSCRGHWCLANLLHQIFTGQQPVILVLISILKESLGCSSCVSKRTRHVHVNAK